MNNQKPRIVHLRNEWSGEGRRSLWAYLDGHGNLRVGGQDLGPGTAGVSSDGEYEWCQVVTAQDIPRVVALLGGEAGEDVLDLLASEWTGLRSYELETRLKESDIPIDRFIWSG